MNIVGPEIGQNPGIPSWRTVFMDSRLRGNDDMFMSQDH
jgi:hypothetical protein